MASERAPDLLTAGQPPRMMRHWTRRCSILRTLALMILATCPDFGSNPAFFRFALLPPRRVAAVKNFSTVPVIMLKTGVLRFRRRVEPRLQQWSLNFAMPRPEMSRIRTRLIWKFRVNAGHRDECAFNAHSSRRPDPIKMECGCRSLMWCYLIMPWLWKSAAVTIWSNMTDPVSKFIARSCPWCEPRGLLRKPWARESMEICIEIKCQ